MKKTSMKHLAGTLLFVATLSSLVPLAHSATPRAAEDAASPVTSTDALPPRAVAPRAAKASAKLGGTVKPQKPKPKSRPGKPAKR